MRGREALMDPLQTILRAVRFSGGVFLDAEFAAPWAVNSRVDPEDCQSFGQQPRHVIAYHYVVEGPVRLQVAGEPTVSLTAGTVILLPHNDPHVLGNGDLVRPVDAGRLIQPALPGRLPRLVHGGGGEATRLLCGFLGMETPDHPVLAALPPALVQTVRDDAAAGWIESSLRFAAAELGSGRVASVELLGRLAELLFVEAARRHLATGGGGRGWLAGLRDPVIGRVLALMHERPAHPWSVLELARESGASRSALADRFKATVGEAPMQYLSGWRLQVAAARLRETADSVTQIAFDSGYESDAAFNRAFKRRFGVPPAAWRRGAER
jgi:AraC-like DNA-binding protein